MILWVERDMTPVEQYYAKAASAKEDFIALLDGQADEALLLEFFEHAPWLLVCDPNSPVVFSRLPAAPGDRSDLAFFSQSGRGAILHLIKLAAAEAFAPSDQFTSAFNNALLQVRQWAFHSVEGRLPVLENLNADGLRVESLLVAGRREELSNLARRKAWRELNRKLPEKIRVRTYDRFIEELPLVSNFFNSVTEVRCERCETRAEQRGPAKPAAFKYPRSINWPNAVSRSS